MKKKNAAAIGGVATVAILVGALLLGMRGEARGPAMLSMNIPSGTYHPGDSINVSVLCSPNNGFVKGWECKIHFNKNILNAVQVREGDFFQGHSTFFNAGVINNTQGNIINMYDLVVGPGNASASGSIMYITFQAVKYGLCNITFYEVGVVNETQYINSTYINASVFVYSPYDMNGDKQVNIQDIIDVAFHYGQTGSPGWIPEDVNKDGKVKLFDLLLVAVHWGPY